MRLVSIAGGGDLGVEIDLTAVSQDIDAPVKEYEPETYPALYLRFEEDGATIMAFTSGKYNIAGAESMEELEETHDRFISTIEELMDIELNDARDTLELRNMVYVDELENPVDLGPLVSALGIEYADYEPEQFPAIEYSPPDKDGHFKIFSTGKVTLTGTTQPESVDERFEELEKRVQEFTHSE